MLGCAAVATMPPVLKRFGLNRFGRIFDVIVDIIVPPLFSLGATVLIALDFRTYELCVARLARLVIK